MIRFCKSMWGISSVMVLLLLLGWNQALAEPQPPLEKHGERLEIITMWKMMETLNLDRQTAEKILELRRSINAEKKSIERELEADFDALRKELAKAAGSNDQELNRIIQAIRTKHKQWKDLKDKQYNELTKILTVRQQAQLFVFLKDFAKELREMLRPPGRPPGLGPRMGEGPPRPHNLPGEVPPPGPPGRLAAHPGHPPGPPAAPGGGSDLDDPLGLW